MYSVIRGGHSSLQLGSGTPENEQKLRQEAKYFTASLNVHVLRLHLFYVPYPSIKRLLYLHLGREPTNAY